MLGSQSPRWSGSQIQAPKGSRRRPLQPKNTPSTPISNLKPKLGIDWFEKKSAPIQDSNKENIHPNINGGTIADKTQTDPIKIELFDASLAEELSSIRKKLERLKADKDRTEKMLNDRELVLDLQLKELETRGEVQKQLEIQVDRLYRLKELKLSCMRISPIRSLREKEQEKKTKQQQQQMQQPYLEEQKEEKEQEHEEGNVLVVS